MDLEHSYMIPVPGDRAWDVMLDVERVARCVPGLDVESVAGGQMRATFRFKVGPIRMAYEGTARLSEKDRASGLLVLAASGKETKGTGTASATVRTSLEDHGDQTRVVVLTNLNVTGKPAQFGRGVMTEIGAKLIKEFAANLASMIAAGQIGEIRRPANQPPEHTSPDSGRYGQIGSTQAGAARPGIFEPSPGNHRELGHAGEASAALREIVAEYGPQALSRPGPLSSLLADLLPDAPKITRILVAAAEDRVADSLREHVSQGMDPLTATRLTASSFTAATLFTPEACAWAVSAIAAALGMTDRVPTIVVQPPEPPA